MSFFKTKKVDDKYDEFLTAVNQIETNLKNHVDCISSGVMQKYEASVEQIVHLTEENEQINYKYVDKCLELDISKSEI